VLRGWDMPGKAARHDLQVGDVRVRNVPTNIRDEDGGTRLYGNSIFVFETAGLASRILAISTIRSNPSI
jgi:hypothetical protein